MTTLLLTLQEAAKELGISPKTVRMHVARGELAYHHFGFGQKRKMMRFSREDLMAMVKTLTISPRPDPEPAPLPTPPPAPPALRTIETKKKRAQRVYFIRAGDIVKIGVAVDPKERLRTLQVARTERLELLLTLKGGVEREARLHGIFREQCVSGEWFTYPGPVAAYIEKIRGSE